MTMAGRERRLRFFSPTSTPHARRTTWAAAARRAPAAATTSADAQLQEEVTEELSELLDSPLAPLHEAYVGGAVAWEEWAGYKTATYLGDTDEELRRVRTGCAAC